MTLLVPTASEGTLLSLILSNTTVLRLYVNNVTPGNGDTAATYTEMSTQGYAAATLAGGSWTINTGSRPATASFAQQQWTANGTGGTTLVYGYFVVLSGSGLLLWAERFSDGPYTMMASGDVIAVTPQFQAT